MREKKLHVKFFFLRIHVKILTSSITKDTTQPDNKKNRKNNNKLKKLQANFLG